MARQMTTRMKTRSRLPKMTTRRKLELVPRGESFTMPGGKVTVTAAEA